MKQRPAVSIDIPEPSDISVHSSHELSGWEASSASPFSYTLQNFSTLDLREWAAATRLLNSNSFLFNFSLSSWSCCIWNVTACLFDASSFKRSHSLSSCFLLRCSHSSFSCCNCNASPCLWDSSFKRSDSLSSCILLKCSKSAWICCICNACSCLFDSSSFKRSHSCVSCCTCMWSSSCFVFKFAWEFVFMIPSTTNPQKNTWIKVIELLFIPTEDQNPSHLGPCLGLKNKIPMSSSHLLNLVFQPDHQNARTSVHGPEPPQILVSKTRQRPVRVKETEPGHAMIAIPRFSPVHSQLEVTNGLPKSTATCRDLLHGDIVQVHLLNHFVAWFGPKEKQVQHRLRSGAVTLQGSPGLAPKGRPVYLNDPCVPHCPLHQLHAPKIQGSVPEVSQCWYFNWSLFNTPWTRWSACEIIENNFSGWGDTVFLKCQQIPFDHPTHCTLFPRNHCWAIMEEIACSIHMPMALANETQREGSAKSKLQEDHEKRWEMCEGIARRDTGSTTTYMQYCMVSTCLSCYWQDLMDWCWHEPTILLILAG